MRQEYDEKREISAKQYSQDLLNNFTKPGAVIPVDMETTQKLVTELTEARATIDALAKALDFYAGNGAKVCAGNPAVNALQSHARAIQLARGG